MVDLPQALRRQRAKFLREIQGTRKKRGCNWGRPTTDVQDTGPSGPLLSRWETEEGNHARCL